MLPVLQWSHAGILACASSLLVHRWYFPDLLHMEILETAETAVLFNPAFHLLLPLGIYEMQVMATFVDVVYGSEDKERAVTILTNMMVYVLPFLKTHR